MLTLYVPIVMGSIAKYNGTVFTVLRAALTEDSVAYVNRHICFMSKRGY